MVPPPGNTYRALKNALIHDMPRKHTNDINEKKSKYIFTNFKKKSVNTLRF